MVERLPGVELIRLPLHTDPSGVLTVYEGESGVPFRIARCFTIGSVPVRGVRGRHAHRDCMQLVSCVKGAVECRWHDGRSWRSRSLQEGPEAMLVRPGIWLEITFVAEDSVILVICDRPYEPHDYVRDWDQFIAMLAGDATST